MELQNGKVRSARKLGLKYLKMAERNAQSEHNLMGIGDTYFDLGDYKIASDYFRRACMIRNSYFNLNNFGLSLYMQNEYKDASKCFKKALDYCNDLDYADIYPVKSVILSAYAFSMLKFDIRKTRALSVKLIHSDVCHIDIDEFALAYLCGDYQLAYSFIKNLFDSWSLDISTMAMVFDCLFKLRKNYEAKEYLRLQIESLHGYVYDISKEINNVNKAFADSKYREKVISDFRYIPQILKQCYYVHCFCGKG